MIRVLLFCMLWLPCAADAQIFADNYEPFAAADFVCENGVCRRAPLVKATLPVAAAVKKSAVTVSRPVIRTVQYVAEPVYVYQVPSHVFYASPHYHRHTIWCRLRNR